MYQAILFDMDGTIVDTEGVWAIAADYLVSRRGVELTQEQKHQLRRETAGQAVSDTALYINMLLPQQEDTSHIMKELIQTAEQHFTEGISFIPGFEKFHNRLRSYQVQSALATNADRRMLRVTDRQLNLQQFFSEHMYCVDDVDGAGKPAPDLYRYAAQQLGITPDNAVVIEDSAPGLQAAMAAGAYCIGINTNGDRTKLHNAHMIVDGYDEIDLTAIFPQV